MRLELEINVPHDIHTPDLRLLCTAWFRQPWEPEKISSSIQNAKIYEDFEIQTVIKGFEKEDRGMIIDILEKNL